MDKNTHFERQVKLIRYRLTGKVFKKTKGWKPYCMRLAKTYFNEQWFTTNQLFIEFEYEMLGDPNIYEQFANVNENHYEPAFRRALASLCKDGYLEKTITDEIIPVKRKAQNHTILLPGEPGYKKYVLQHYPKNNPIYIHFRNGGVNTVDACRVAQEEWNAKQLENAINKMANQF